MRKEKRHHLINIAEPPSPFPYSSASTMAKSASMVRKVIALREPLRIIEERLRGLGECVPKVMVYINR